MSHLMVWIFNLICEFFKFFYFFFISLNESYMYFIKDLYTMWCMLLETEFFNSIYEWYSMNKAAMFYNFEVDWLLFSDDIRKHGFLQAMMNTNIFMVMYPLFLTFIVVLCVLFFAIMTMWTRASGPRVSLEQLSALTWKNLMYIMLFSLMLVTIVMII